MRDDALVGRLRPRIRRTRQHVDGSPAERRVRQTLDAGAGCDRSQLFQVFVREVRAEEGAGAPARDAPHAAELGKIAEQLDALFAFDHQEARPTLVGRGVDASQQTGAIVLVALPPDGGLQAALVSCAVTALEQDGLARGARGQVVVYAALDFLDALAKLDGEGGCSAEARGETAGEVYPQMRGRLAVPSGRASDHLCTKYFADGDSKSPVS